MELILERLPATIAKCRNSRIRNVSPECYAVRFQITFRNERVGIRIGGFFA
jgi:hypothetical protein